MPPFPSLEVCAIDFAFDSNVMASQPFSIDRRAAEPQIDITSRGLAIPKTMEGEQFIVTWGERFVSVDTVAEIRAALGSKLEHAVAWTDPDGTVFSFLVVIDALEVSFSYDTPGFYKPVRLVMFERAPARSH